MPYGRASVEWFHADGVIHVQAVIAPNADAVVDLKEREPFRVGPGAYEWTLSAEGKSAPLQPVSVDSALATLMEDEEAYREIVRGWSTILPKTRQR